MNYIIKNYPLAYGAAKQYPQQSINVPGQNAFCHFDGNLCYAFLLDYRSAAVLCVAIDPIAQKVCFYSNAPQSIFSGVINQGLGPYVRILGPKSFACYNGNGSLVYFRVPNIFNDGAFIQVNSINFTPQPPCGAATLNASYYDAVNATAAFLYEKTYAGNNSDFWVSIYKANNNALTFVSGGYLGNFNSGNNPFVNQSFPYPTDNAIAGVSSTHYSYQSNGMIQFSNVLGSDGQYRFGGGQQRIKYNGLQCGVPNGGQSYTYFDNAFLFNQNAFGGYGPYGNNFAHSLSGAIGFNSNQNTNTYVIGNAQYGVGINTTQGRFGAFYVGNGNFVALDTWLITVPNIYAFQVAYGNVPGLVDPVLPPNVLSQASSLLNWHRPISTRGLYKT